MIKFIAKLFPVKRGQTIIEGVVAVTAIMVIVSAVAVAILTGVNNSQFGRQQALATKYAQQGMEQIRYLRNNSPVGFALASASTSTYCFNLVTDLSDFLNNPLTNYLVTPGASCPTVNIPQDSLKRSVTFNPNSPIDCSDGTRVTVSVFWSSTKCPTANRYCHETKVVSCLADESESGRTL